MLPPLQSLATKTVDQEWRGVVLGLQQSVMSLGVIVSTGVSGPLFAQDPTLPNWSGGVLTILAVIPGLILWRWERRSPASYGRRASKS